MIKTNKNNFYVETLLLLLLIIFSNITLLPAEEYNWQYWNGPNRNGISDESDWDPEFLKKMRKANRNPRPMTAEETTTMVQNAVKQVAKYEALLRQHRK